GDLSIADKMLTYADTYVDGKDFKESVYDHLKRILDFSAEQVGASGICKGLRADWNDCLNLGGGESAMVSFLHYWALTNFVTLAEKLGRIDDVNKYSDIAKKVKDVCNDKLWDEEWFIRGVTKSGRKIGCHEDEEGRVHLESNSWAVLSGAADEEHGMKALEAIDKYLYTPYGILLNQPAYTKPDPEIGFVTRVYPGLKENAAIFSHPNPWAQAAACVLGRGDLAMKFYDALCPYYQNDKIEIRESEPYSYCQFIAGRDHSAYGRARHPFMTGSGGWSYYTATAYILGIRPDYDKLIVDPCVPKTWKEFKVNRVFRGASYNIHVLNPQGVMKGVKEIKVDGNACDYVPVFEKGTKHDIEIIMG
ncbi:MAG: N,N'-diacetylchitobiose phosphorylase, partial [Lachnospiraceae bacterium]|nr:N,N'-diacetylchitobiose phosphorylase [Lachnospiraceae bacterium]